MIEDLILVGPATEVRLSSEQNRHGRTTTKDLPTYAVHTISEFVSSVRPEQNHSLREVGQQLTTEENQDEVLTAGDDPK